MRQPPRPRPPHEPAEQPEHSTVHDRHAIGGRSASTQHSESSRRPASTQRSASATRSASVERIRGPRQMRTPLSSSSAVDAFGERRARGQKNSKVTRLDERRKARRRLSLRTLMSIIVTVLLAAAAIWAIFFSPLFALTTSRITVEGANEVVPAEQVIASVDEFSGTPITRLSMSSVVQAVNSLTLVRDSQVQRSWPDGLTITITVRRPVMVEMVGENARVIDEDGVEIPGDPPEGLPVVALPSEDPLRAQAIEQVQTVWAALSSELRQMTGKISADGQQLTITLADNRVVRWGTQDDSDLKSRVLKVLIDQRPAQVYDVSSPTRPVTS